MKISPIEWEGSTPAIFRFIQLQLLPYGGRAPPFYSDFRVITPFTKKRSPRKRFTKQAFHQKTFSKKTVYKRNRSPKKNYPRKRFTKQTFHQETVSKKTVYKTNLSPKNVIQENGLQNKPFTKTHSPSTKQVEVRGLYILVFLLSN